MSTNSLDNIIFDSSSAKRKFIVHSRANIRPIIFRQSFISPDYDPNLSLSWSVIHQIRAVYNVHILFDASVCGSPSTIWFIDPDSVMPSSFWSDSKSDDGSDQSLSKKFFVLVIKSNNNEKFFEIDRRTEILKLILNIFFYILNYYFICCIFFYLSLFSLVASSLQSKSSSP